jgi:hypothetical protein
MLPDFLSDEEMAALESRGSTQPMPQPSFGERYAPAVIRAESSGNPNAVSPVGAQGLMQIMPDTGRELAASAGMQYDPFNPQQNQQLGTQYLDQLYRRYQDPALALASYNWGMGNVDKAIEKAGGVRSWEAIAPYAPAETQAYVPKVLQLSGQEQPATVAPQGSSVMLPGQQGGVDVIQSPVAKPVEQQPMIGDFLSDEQMAQLESQGLVETMEMQPPARDYSWGDYFSGIGGQAAEGLTFNFSDEMGITDQGFQDQFAQDYPKTALASEITGGILPTVAAYIATAATAGGGAPAAAVTTASTAGNIARLASALKTGGKLAAGIAPAAAKTGIGRVAQGVGLGAGY